MSRDDAVAACLRRLRLRRAAVVTMTRGPDRRHVARDAKLLALSHGVAGQAIPSFQVLRRDAVACGDGVKRVAAGDGVEKGAARRYGGEYRIGQRGCGF